MRPKRTSKIRILPVQWQDGAAFQPEVRAQQPPVVAPESYFIGVLGLGASLTVSLPPIILTEKTSREYELKET